MYPGKYGRGGLRCVAGSHGNQNGQVLCQVGGIRGDQEKLTNKINKTFKIFLEVNNVKYSSSSLINFGFGEKKLVKLMEASTVYTFCN